MTSKELAKLHQQFTPEQKQLLLEKTIKGAHTIDEWLKIFREVSVYDRYQDKEWGRIESYQGAFLPFLSAFIVIISFVITKDLKPINLLLMAGLVILNVAYFLYIGHRKSKWEKTDLSNHLRLFIVPTLVLLKEEVKKNQLVHLDLSLADTHSDKFFKRKIKDAEFYEQIWLIAKTKLADGTRLQWKAHDVFRYRKYYKHSASGKRKQKIKKKAKFYLDVRVAIPKSRYQLNKKIGGLDMKEENGYYVFKGKGRNVAETMSGSMEVNLFLSLISGAYRQVTLQ